MSDQPELQHIAVARKLIGVKEIGSTNKGKELKEWLEQLTGTKIDEKKGHWLYGQPWCGTFVAQVFKEAGLSHKIPKDFFRAKEWEKAGTKLDKPAYGCVVTFTRDGGGHVGFVVGKTKSGLIKVLGGNQSNAVTIQDFDPKRVTSYRWVSSGSVPNEHRYDLPVLPAGKISTNEA